MRNRIHSLILCGLLGLLVSCGSGGDNDVSFLQEAPVDVPAKGPKIILGTEKWTAAIYEKPVISAGNPVSIPVASSPAVAPDGTIYVGSSDNSLYALKNDGTVKWRYVTGGQIVASPAIGSDGTVYVGSADRQLYAINPDGTLKWVYPTKAVLSTSPALGADGTIYVGGTNLDKTIYCSPNPDKIPAMQFGTLYAINPDGTLEWDVSLSGIVNSSPVIASDGTIYIGSAGDTDYDRIDPCDKTTEFPASAANPLFPVNGHVYAINPDGTLKWDFKTLGNVDSSAAVASDGTIYIGSDYGTKAYDGDDKTKLIDIGSLTTGFVYAINPGGTLKWVTDLLGNVKSSPAIGSDGTIYVGSDIEDLFALNPIDGTIKWEFPTRGPVISSPSLAADGTIYIGSNDTSLYAVNPDGTVKWGFMAKGPVSSSPAVTADGTVYFVSGTGSQYQFHALSGGSPLADTPWPKFRRNLPNTGRQ